MRTIAQLVLALGVLGTCLSATAATGQTPGAAPARPATAKPATRSPVRPAASAEFDRLAREASAAREAGRVDEALGLTKRP